MFLTKGKVTCRDINAGRIERLKRMLRSYIRQEELDRLVEIEFNSEKGGVHKEAFDKVLVDVPCTNDKRSLKEEEKNNIFAKRRIEERTELPAKQAALLRFAFLHGLCESPCFLWDLKILNFVKVRVFSITSFRRAVTRHLCLEKSRYYVFYVVPT